MERIGLIAGGGEIPILFAHEARKKGAKTIGFALKGLTSPDLDKACDRTHWFDTSQIAKFFLLLLAERIRKVVLLGKVDKSVFYTDVKKHEEGINLFKNAQDKSDYGILEKVTSEFEKKGIKVINAIDYLSRLMPEKGVLTDIKLSDKEKEDLAFGFKTAKALSHLDIGQTVVVKDKAVVSVEAMEGTDATIKRAALICREGFVVVKVSRPHQDMRWDVPVVGIHTINLIAENKGRVLAIEEKKMFLADKEKCVKLADQNGISIVVV